MKTYGEKTQSERFDQLDRLRSLYSDTAAIAVRLPSSHPAYDHLYEALNAFRDYEKTESAKIHGEDVID